MGLEAEPPTLQRPRSPRSAVNAAEEIPEASGRGRARRGRGCGHTERSGRSAVTSARPCPAWGRRPRGRGSLGLCPTKMKRRGSFSATLLRSKIGPGGLRAALLQRLDAFSGVWGLPSHAQRCGRPGNGGGPGPGQRSGALGPVGTAVTGRAGEPLPARVGGEWDGDQSRDAQLPPTAARRERTSLTGAAHVSVRTLGAPHGRKRMGVRDLV